MNEVIRSLLISLSAAPLLASPANAMSSKDEWLRACLLRNPVWNPIPAESAIRAGADVNARDDQQNNETFLIAVVKAERPLEEVNFLLNHGADPNLRDGSGKSALDWAYRRMHTMEGQKIIFLLNPELTTSLPRNPLCGSLCQKAWLKGREPAK